MATFGLGRAWPLDMHVVTNDEEKLIYLDVWGPIIGGDDQKFKATVMPYLQRGYVLFQVSIFTIGGDVDTAEAIGDQIRMLQARTVAPKVFANEPGYAACWFVADTSYGSVGYMPQTNYKRDLSTNAGASWCDCASACFLIWASGVTREGNFVGIHRFRFNELSFGTLPPDQAKKQYEQAEDKFKAYLKKLDVPDTILDVLFATPSTSMHYLKKAELDLVESTPYLEEQTQARCGASKARSYQQGNYTIYQEDPVHIDCYRGILKGLMKEGAAEYLKVYGAPNVIPTTQPQVTAEPVAPQAPITTVTIAPEVPASVPDKKPAEAPTSYWKFFGSTMYLTGDGKNWKMFYDVPRLGLAELGISHGSPFFEGILKEATVVGEVMAYAKNCPVEKYPVNGTVSSDGHHVAVTGKRPSRNERCALVGSKNVTIVVDYDHGF